MPLTEPSPSRPLHCIAATGAKRTRFDASPDYAEGLYDLGAGVYAWMVPNGSWGEANAGLVVGEGASLLIDTLWDVRLTQQMLDTMRNTLSHPPIVTLVNTHGDGDHYFGNELLADADIITSDASLEEMAHKTPGQMLAFGKLGKVMQMLGLPNLRQAGRWFTAMGAPYDFRGVTHTPAKRGFSGRLELEVGGRKIDFIEVGPAHTAGDVIVHVPDAGVVLAADIMFLGSTPVMWAGPLENWFKALDVITALEPEIVVPGHGPLTDLAGVAQVKAYWQFVDDAVQTRFDAGMSARHAAHDIARSAAFQAQPFADWIAPERIMTNTHILYRQKLGKSGHPALPTLLKILYDQAQLAATLPTPKTQGSVRN